MTKLSFIVMNMDRLSYIINNISEHKDQTYWVSYLLTGGSSLVRENVTLDNRGAVWVSYVALS